MWSSFAFIKPNGIRNLVVTSLRLTQGRTLPEGREESQLCFPANTSGDLHVAGGWGRAPLRNEERIFGQKIPKAEPHLCSR